MLVDLITVGTSVYEVSPSMVGSWPALVVQIPTPADMGLALLPMFQPHLVRLVKMRPRCSCHTYQHYDWCCHTEAAQRHLDTWALRVRHGVERWLREWRRYHGCCN